MFSFFYLWSPTVNTFSNFMFISLISFFWTCPPPCSCSSGKPRCLSTSRGRVKLIALVSIFHSDIRVTSQDNLHRLNTSAWRLHHVAHWVDARFFSIGAESKAELAMNILNTSFFWNQEKWEQPRFNVYAAFSCRGLPFGGQLLANKLIFWKNEMKKTWGIARCDLIPYKWSGQRLNHAAQGSRC